MSPEKDEGYLEAECEFREIQYSEFNVTQGL